MPITQPFLDAHQHCIELFQRLRACQASGDWTRTQPLYWHFRHVMEAHFAAEEHGLFPAFELATGVRVGPTSVLRSDHETMRALLEHIGGTLAVRDEESCRQQFDELERLIEAHTAREEHILYSMDARPLDSLPERLLRQATAELSA